MKIDLYDKKRLGIYVHVPFCISKCAYCDFNSFVPKSELITADYVDAVVSHMEDYKEAGKGYVADSVYIGGGTPTALPQKELKKLLTAVGRNFDVSKKAEFTVEANPGTVDLSYFKMMRRCGVNRISMGLQSADNRELAALSRCHTRQEFADSFMLARQAGFDNISVDLMFGIPGQTVESLLKSLAFVMRMEPEHISLYNLKIEPGTPFYENRDELKALLPSEEIEFEMYRAAIAAMEKRGYMQYEISNFARFGYRCLHNLKYWNCEEYLGFGVSAHSYFNSNRFAFIDSVDRYIAAVKDKNSPVRITKESETVEARERMGEYIMLRFRLTDGIGSVDFARRFGVSFESLYGRRIEKYVRDGFIEKREGSYALTPAGMFVSNYILSDILEFEDLGAVTGNIT
ncbi:MAG: radical SAM family heme chaperone HemW [Clostridia bacterium]|nr:radical SAM family heme chaperone HemW [Clostridia bacterium]